MSSKTNTIVSIPEHPISHLMVGVPVLKSTLLSERGCSVCLTDFIPSLSCDYRILVLPKMCDKMYSHFCGLLDD